METIIKNILFVESPKKINAYKKIEKIIFKNKDNLIHENLFIATKGHIVKITPEIIKSYAQEFNYYYTSYFVSVSKTMWEFINKSKNNGNIIECNIYLATDPDREGESISYYVQDYIKNNKLNKNNIKINFYRIRSHSLTSESIIKSIEESKKDNIGVDINLYYSYLTRVFIDLLVGINGSTLVRNKIPLCKSIGRVQSVILTYLVKKEIEIKNHIPKLLCDLSSNIDYTTIYYDGKEVKSEYNYDEIKDIYNKNYLNQKYTIISKKESNKYLYKINPLDTPNAQIILSKKVSANIKELMSILQNLYEQGLITYHRTDTTLLLKENIYNGKNIIVDKYGKNYANIYYKSSEVSKGNHGHYGIQYASIKKMSKNNNNIVPSEDKLDKNAFITLKWIIFYTLAPLMKSPAYKITKFIAQNNKNPKLKLEIEHKELIFEGYYKLYDELKIDKYIKKSGNLYNINDEIEVKLSISNKFTLPPFRYKETDLVELMKVLKIGRPSTYSYILEVLKNRYYSKIYNKYYYVTNTGFCLSKIINAFLSDVLNVNFTAKMEEDLSDIANNKEKHIIIKDKYFNSIKEKFDILNNVEKQVVYEKIIDGIMKNITFCTKCALQDKIDYSNINNYIDKYTDGDKILWINNNMTYICKKQHQLSLEECYNNHLI